MRRASHRQESPPASQASRAADYEGVVFDRTSVQAVDRAAIDEYGIPGIVLMENAARGLLDAAQRMLAGEANGARKVVLIVCGPGNNGGDGYALARHLHNHGIESHVARLGRPTPQSDAGINLQICEHMRVPIFDARNLATVDPAAFALVVDAIFGTGLDREVGGDAAAAISWINRADRPVLAVDVPSGMDCNTGRPLGACVRATVTVTFVGLKSGFLGFEAQKLLGEVIVADIGAPRALIDRFGRRLPAPRRGESPRTDSGASPRPPPRRD